MATILYTLLVATVLAAAALPHTTAQSPSSSPTTSPVALPPPTTMPPVSGGMAPAPALDCFTYIVGLSDCLNFVMEGSNQTRPDPPCCPEVSNLISTQPICLCQLLANPGQVGLPVDINKALQLPSVCNLSSTPPVSLCALIGVPVSVPGPSEAPSPSDGGSLGVSPGQSGGPISESPESPASALANSGTSKLISSTHFLVGSALVFFMSFV